MHKQAAFAHSLIQKIHPYFSKNDPNLGEKSACRAYLGLPSADAVSGVFDYLDEPSPECKPFQENFME
jgi:hypothetical protein